MQKARCRLPVRQQPQKRILDVWSSMHSDKLCRCEFQASTITTFASATNTNTVKRVMQTARCHLPVNNRHRPEVQQDMRQASICHESECRFPCKMPSRGVASVKKCDADSTVPSPCEAAGTERPPKGRLKAGICTQNVVSLAKCPAGASHLSESVTQTAQRHPLVRQYAQAKGPRV